MAHSPPNLRPSIPLEPLGELKASVLSRKTLLKKDSVIVLVCGAKSNASNPTCRDLFMDYGQKHLAQFKFYQAEQVFQALRDLKDTDLLSLEGEFSRFSDCIIVFLESSGALAEIGAFAMDEQLVKILLSVNDIRLKNELSFINLGPIAKADKKSKFKPTLYVNFKHVLKYVPEIEKRLNTKLRRLRNKRIDLSSFGKFTGTDEKIRMLFLADLISLFSPMSHSDLFFVLRRLYGKDTRFSLKVELGMLEGLGVIVRDGRMIIRSLDERDCFFDFGFDPHVYRAMVVNYYSKHFRDKLKMLVTRSGL